MAGRPLDYSSQALKRPATVKAAAAVTKGFGVIFGSVDTEVENSGANGKVSGIALETGAAGEVVTIAEDGIVPVLVGTGGATRGEFAIMAADGFTNQTLGGGTTVKYIAGKFMQSGVFGDYVGLKVNFFAAGAA